jgi:putative ABC transport system permease protein
MNISFPLLAVAAILLAVPLYVFYRLDRRLLRQWAVVMGRAVITLLLVAACLHYVFLWNRVWMTLVWVLASSAVAVTVYCRRRWLIVPVFVGMMATTLPIGLLVITLVSKGSLFEPAYFIPVMSLLQAEALFVSRRGLSTYVLNRKEHQSLYEYLRGNGATELEALRPFVAKAMSRSIVPVLSQTLLVGIVFVPSLFCGLLIGGVAPLQAAVFLALTAVAAQCSAMLTLMISLYLHHQLRK